MNNDQRWLRELIQVNKESQDQDRLRLDERWDRLSSGELSPEEEEELRALAESSEEAREAFEAFRPLGPDFQAGVVRAIQEQSSAHEAVPPKPLPEPLPFPRRTVHRVGWSSLAAAAAAVVVFLVRPSPPIPDYSLDDDLSGGVRAMRGDGPEAQRISVFAPGDRIGMVLRPATGTLGKGLAAECFLRRGRDQRRLEIVRTKIDPEGGSVQMECSIDRDLPPGTWTLFAVVGRGRLPTAADLPDLPPGVKIRTRSWVGIPKEIRIQPREPPP